MKKFLNWVASTDTPRWLVAVCFVASTMLSVLIAKLTEDNKRFDDNRAQQIRSLQESMVQFQIYVAALTSEVFEKKTVSSEAKNNVIKNLNEQWARTQVIEALASPAEKPDITAYRAAIGKMIDATRQIDQLTEMGDFWTAASRLLVSRNKLDAKLKALI